MKNTEENISNLEENEKSISLVTNNKDSSSNQIIAFNMEKKLLSTINELDRRYKEEISLYSEKLQRYNIEIEKLKNKISIQENEVAKAERELIPDETLIEYESKSFEKLHNKLSNQISSLGELADEYKTLLSEDEYGKKIASKKRFLLDLLEDISEKESLLLNKELERLNHYAQYQEQKKIVEKFRNELKEIELEKGYFESTELQKITPLKTHDLPSETVESLPDVVDAEVINA